MAVALVLASTLSLGTTCGRGAVVESAVSYPMDVVNPFPEAMVVSFDDGTGSRLLGTVSGGSTERFIVAGSAAQTVTIIAVDEDGTRTVRRTVTLRPNQAVRVQLR